MTASIKERKNIEEHLPHDLLKELYLNSRVSIKQLEKKFGISHHTLSKCLKECEKKYKLHYTIDVDTNLLGFSEARILAIKFEKIPDIKLLKKVFEKDPYVQNAYLTSGDFDVILHVIGQTNTEYAHWEFKFRMGFSNYRPRIKASTLNHIVEGFIPINSKLINKSKEINEAEKKILIKLIENSRIRLKDLSKTTKLSQMKILYKIEKLKKDGIIKRFTTCIQNPEKRMLLFYAITFIPNENHHKNHFLKFVEKITNNNSVKDITTDYSVVCETSGSYDAIHFCNFKDGTSFDEIGPNLLKKSWEGECPVVEQSILTDLITGNWPFNTNNYFKWGIEIEAIKNHPIIFEIYK
jgi:DNA-binding Lrp family transcriptional regulator